MTECNIDYFLCAALLQYNIWQSAFGLGNMLQIDFDYWIRPPWFVCPYFCFSGHFPGKLG